MLIVVSPAKTLDYDTPPQTADFTLPEMLEDSAHLIEILRGYPIQGLERLMSLSRKLAELNHARYRDWHLPFTPENAKQAVLAMKGDVYTGLDAESFGPEDFAFAQGHLRILSGLYGVLRPLDLMQPYRLEMGTHLPNPAGDTLYAYWGERITARLNRDLAAQGDRVLVNLASNEYFKSVVPGALAGEIVTPQFKERKGDGWQIIGIHAKRARGLMSRFIIRHRIADPERLKAFDDGGYRYNGALSKGNEWVFSRG